MLPNHRFGSARNGCSLKKHTANSISERSHTPPFDLAHFRVELTFHFILKVQDFFEVAPADIRGQSCNLLMVWPSLGKTNHVKQVLTAESWAVAGGQLSRQCRDNLFAIFCACLAQNIMTNACSDVPIKKHKFSIHSLGNAALGRVYERPNVLKETGG